MALHRHDFGAPSTVASATGLGRRGRVRMLEPPHTQDNYLLQEMGFRDRPQAPRAAAPDRAARRLRPARLLLTLVGAVARRRRSASSRAALAVASAALGLVVERWLFFAEAKHTVTLYYGAEAV